MDDTYPPSQAIILLSTHLHKRSDHEDSARRRVARWLADGQDHILGVAEARLKRLRPPESHGVVGSDV
ncbi:hypothetical protein M231_04054 [Tremella mesenterica]|uniref:Uncharacterized protein n=1 Tax=Tremella mesenterica TaxID=5217 RepID=A0A4V1M401_TREME|nr:hypothetical protein M231_04054 [Tremella mesenterica]